INGVISELASQIKDKEKEITTAQKLIEEKQAKFKQRVRVQYEEGSVGYIKSFFEAESMNDLLYRYAIVQEVLIHDKDLIDQMERAKRAIEEAKAAIEDNKVQTEGQKKQLDDKKRLETSKQQEQQKIINDLQKDQDAWQKQLDAAQAAEAALKRQIAANASNSNSSTYTGGKFDWPVPSSYRITSEFSAARTHPVLGVVRRHDGIDIGAPSGSNIVAAGDGTVLFAGWNGGYGNCVIIDHGGGYTTLYGHASSLLVSSGAKVSRGQVIAKVGSTGVSTGPHLHFEVCINGVAKEPTQFLK
ncbi:MAG: peptidoglycan DD-metalloendopeptidase family protein, partial [Oscillospiraceae bacterium]|nr:peptidoglycan DD-metalloendopeptidase family protein [Oscillospiraceae bacterium]